MRLRLLAFLPFGTLIAIVILVSASSLVLAIERSIAPESVLAVRLERYESECDVLFREIHELSHEVTSCGEDPRCLGSPLLCAPAMDSSIDREYERLRVELNQRCGVPLGLMDYAWDGPSLPSDLPSKLRSHQASAFGSEPTPGWESCGAAHDWLESAASGETQPETFVF